MPAASVPRVSTWRRALIALTCMGFPVWVTHAAGPDVQASWESAYSYLRNLVDNGQVVSRQGRDVKVMPTETVRNFDKVLNEHSLTFATDRDPLDIILRRTRALCDHLDAAGAPGLPGLLAELTWLDNQAATVNPSDQNARKNLFIQACGLQRRIAFANPLLAFDSLLFTQRHITGPLQNSNTTQLEWTEDRGYGPFILTDYRTDSPRVVNFLQSSRIENGRNAGRLISEFADFVNGLALSYDGATVLFSRAEQRGQRWDRVAMTEKDVYNVFKVNIDGTGLYQLTDSRWDDYQAVWLPGGRVAFLSTRCGGFSRCSRTGWYNDFQPTATLFSMKADGSDVVRLSYHETNELYPCVDNDGMIVYTRWDYIDRDFSAAHHHWVCYPDGRDPRSYHGNYPLPRCRNTPLCDESGRDGRPDRPYAEYYYQAIPGTHGTYVATASGHHECPQGVLVVVDVNIRDDDAMSQVTRVDHPELPLQYDQGGGVGVGNRYPPQACFYGPWPLDMTFYLAGKEDGGIYLLDAFGNEILLARRSGGPVERVIPVGRRPEPPTIATQTCEGERSGSPEHRRAVVSVQNVYISDFDWPAGVVENKEVKALRILQVVPRPWTSPMEPWCSIDQDIPRMGYPYGGIVKVALGTVPVEEDGSAYFEAPVGKEILFQALDKNGMAIQGMRSGTYVHPGEHLSCLGCHEDKWEAVPPPSQPPLALRRQPSRPQPQAGGIEPVFYHRQARPVFERSCMPCHTGKQNTPQLVPYWDPNAWDGKAPLANYTFFTDASEAYGHGYRSIAGKFGARASRIGRALLGPSHQQYLREGEFTDEDVRRIALWIDANSLELGNYSIDPSDQTAQRRGEIVWDHLPTVDTTNLSGIELDRPLPGATRASSLPGPRPARGVSSLHMTAGRVRVSHSAGSLSTLRVFDYRGRCCAVRTVSGDEVVNLAEMKLPGGFYVVALQHSAGPVVGNTCVTVR